MARHEPWHPAVYGDDIIIALKALRDGTASDIQQKKALAWIVNEASMVGQQSFYPGADGDRITSFIEGRRSVGNQILKLVNDVRPPKETRGD